MGDILKRSNFFIGEIKNVVLTCLRIETRSNIHYFWSFIMQSDLYRFSFCGPGALLPHFNLREQVILFISVIHPWRNFWKEAIFSQLRPKLVLFCLRLETRSKIHYSWSFTTHSISSANFFLLPWCTFTPFYSKRASYFFHLKGSSMKDILERSIFFIGEIKNVVLTCLRLETRSKIHYFWSFIMHSKSSSNFFCCPGALLLHFILREQDILFIWVIHPWTILWKEAIFSQLRPKNMVLFCLRLETGSNIDYSWNFTMHSKTSSNCVLLPWCSSTPFYPERAKYSVHLSDSSKGDILKRSNFFKDESKNVALTCLRLETRSNIHYSWSFTTHSISSANFLCCPGALLLHFTLREQVNFFISRIHPWRIF